MKGLAMRRGTEAPYEYVKCEASTCNASEVLSEEVEGVAMREN